MAKAKTAIGIEGEFLVLAKLAALRYIAAPTLKNTPGIDILVADGHAAKMVQVKTTEGEKSEWVCPILKIAGENLVYIFVNLHKKTTTPPDFHIVPCADVKKALAAEAAVYIRLVQQPGWLSHKSCKMLRILLFFGGICLKTEVFKQVY